MRADAFLKRIALSRRTGAGGLMFVVLACAAVGLAIRFALGPVFGGFPGYVILMPSVVFAALWGGRVAGAATALLCLVGSAALAFTVPGLVAFDPTASVVGGVAYLVTAAILILIGAALRSSVRASQAQIEQLAASRAEAGESEDRFRLVADNIPNLAWMAEPDGAIYWYNRRWFDYTGTTLEQMRGWGWQSVHDPALVDGVADRFRQAIATGEPWEDVFPLRGAQGEWRWFLSRAQPVRDRDGRIERWFGTNTDITEQRATATRLRQSEARFRTAIDAVRGTLWTNTAEGRMEGEQPGWTALTGQSRAQYAGYGWAGAVHPDDARPTLDAWALAVADRRVFEFEHRLKTADGAWSSFAVRAVPIFDAGGEISEWVGVHTDVTAQRQAETALRESEARFRLMADTAPSPVWMTNPDAEVEFVNAALVEYYGAPADRLVGHVWKQAIHPDDQPLVETAMTAARPRRLPYGFEARFQHADGGWRWMRISVNPRFDDRQTFLGYVGMAFDVTETREALDALAAQERRQTFLLELSDRLREMDDPEAIKAEVSRSLGAELGADRVAYGEVHDDQEHISLRKGWARPPLATLDGLWRMADFGPRLIARVRKGERVRIADVTRDPLARAQYAAYADIGAAAVLGAPVMLAGRLRAFLVAHSAHPRVWSDEEAALIDGVAARAWAEVERAGAEAEVRESEARFRAIADTAPVLIWVTRQDRTRAFVNQAYVAFNGGTYEGARLADWRDVVHPEDHARILQESLAGEATGRPFSMEARYRRHDGDYRWLKSFSRPRLGAGGQVTGFVGVAFDVTDIRETNTRLAAAAAERDAILGQLAEGVIVTDPDGKIIFVNEAAVRHHGVESLDVPPEAYADTYHLFTEDGDPHPFEDLPLARAVLKGETVTDARWRIRRPDGTEVIAAGSARPVFGPNEVRIGAVLTLRDETARVEAENRLAESETRFRTVADSAPALIWMTDAAGEVTFLNQRFATFFGMPVETMLADGWKALIHPDERDTVYPEFLRTIARRVRIDAVFRVLHPTLGARWLRCEGIPRHDAAGVFQGYVGANLDVTDAKRAEEDLKRINELLEERVGEALAEKARAEADLMHAQRMEAVGRLTGGVAHDFNNLLTVVIGALDIILRSPDDAAKRQKLGEAALAAARRGEGLTHQLLAFSRRQALRPQALDINAQLRQSEPLLRRAVGEAVEFRLKLRRGGARVSVDPSQFEAALLNLVVNARDALGATGEITIQTMSCAIGAGEVVDLAPGDYVCVVVSDNGCGMSPEVIARVFEPFYTTKAVGKGTGLGLSQVYGFARQSGGAARISSTVGKGTEIRIYLPPLVEGGKAALDAAPVAQRALAAGRRLLLVEDDVSVAAVALELLEGLGLEVRAVETGPEALDLLKRERFDIMLSDVVMPGGMTGIELARECERRHPAMRVVLTSGYAGEDVDAALTDAPWPFLRKPYTGEQLAGVLGDLTAPPTVTATGV